MLAVTALGAFTAPALAQDVLVSNSGQTAAVAFQSVGSSSGTFFTQRFHTGDNPGGYTLSAVGITLGSNGLSGTETLDLHVYTSNSAGTAGSLLHTLSPPATPASAIAIDQIVDFTAPADVTLSADTDYHVAVTSSGSSSDVGLKVTLSNVETGESDWTIEDALRSQGVLDTDGHAFLVRVKGSKNNSPATGDPVITGIARVGETLGVDTSAIADPDDLPGTFSYQWIRVDGGTETEITGETSATYTLVDADRGKKVKVRVSFTDNAGNPESRPSGAYPSSASIVAPPGAPASLTAAAGDGRVRLVWTAPADPGSSAVTGYQVRYAQGASVPAGTAWSAVSLDRAYLTLLVEGLANGAAHALEVRAVNSAGGGAAATMSATPAGGCSPPALGARREVWSGTMMVGKNRSPDSSGLTWGSLNAGFIAGSFGSLSSSSGISFMIGAARYDITTISMPVRTVGFRLLDVNFSDMLLPGPVKAALQLHSCGETRDFSAADIGNGTYYRWLDVETTIDFSLYATREIALSLPANNDATGAPVIVSDIAGMAHVGRTLTASAGMVADADGRPSALNYQWFQVDSSSSVETEIDGATSTTYTPTTADLGHRLKVKVSFTDNLGSPEVRESLETPTVEQPTLMTIAEASATEGSALTFAVTLSPATDRAVTVNWAVSTSGGNTASTNDLTGTTSGGLTFAANETSQTITLNTVQDEIYEGDETFTVTLSGPSNAVLGTDSAATGTIVNDEALPTVTLVLADDTIRESDDPNQSGDQHRTTVTATLDIAIEGNLRITIDSGPALHFPPGDGVRTRLTIPPGRRRATQ